MIRDVQFLSQNRPGPRMGMGHYERLLIHYLMQDSPSADWSFGITFDGRIPEQEIHPESIEPGLRNAGFLGFSTRRLRRLPWAAVRMALNVRARQPKPTLYHSLALTYPLPGGRPGVTTIHDLPPARFPDEGTLPRWSSRAARTARAILAPSAFAKRELVDLLDVADSDVHVVYYGCEHDRFHRYVAPADAPTLAAYDITGPFLIYVGGYTRRKNVRALLDAWKIVAPLYPDLSLALVGPATQLKMLAEESGGPRLVVVGYLDRTTLPGVIKASKALVFPSMYEGFGLPPLEAMALGVPVVAVRAGAIPEIVGDAGLLAEDGSADALAAAMQRLLNNDRLAQQLSAAGLQRAQDFSWHAHARTVLDIYQDVIDRYPSK